MTYNSGIPDLTYSSSLSDALNKNRTDYARLQLQISSNKKYINRSDDPVSTNEAAVLKNNNIQLAQWKSNIQTAQGWETSTDSAVNGIADYMQRVNELCVQAGDGTTASAQDRKAIAEELDGIIESLASYGNTSYLGTYVFAGTDTASPPFTVSRDANNKITGVTYEGNSEQRSIQISESSKMNYGLTGSDSGVPSTGQGVFRFNSLINTGTTEEPVWEKKDVNIFDSLIKFRDAMNSETIPGDLDVTRRELQASVGHVTDKAVSTATSQQKLERLGKNIDSMVTGTTNRIGELEELDLAEATVKLYQFQNNLSASLQMVARMNQLSIVNFI